MWSLDIRDGALSKARKLKHNLKLSHAFHISNRLIMIVMSGLFSFGSLATTNFSVPGAGDREALTVLKDPSVFASCQRRLWILRYAKQRRLRERLPFEKRNSQRVNRQPHVVNQADT